MTFSDDAAGLLLVVLIVGLFALGAVVAVMGLRLAKLRRDYSVALESSEREGLYAAVRSLRESHDTLRGDVATVDGKAETLRGLLSSSTSRVAVVRYDAFEDMGGMLSFSAALLDEHGDGLVISTINGRTEARTYAKPVHGLDSPHTLSTEEVQAIDQAMAMTGRNGRGTPPGGRRRRRAAS